MLRILATAAAASMLLAVAGPRTRAAIATLHSEFTALDALAAPTPAQRTVPVRWVRVGDYTAALASVQAHKSAR